MRDAVPATEGMRPQQEPCNAATAEIRAAVEGLPHQQQQQQQQQQQEQQQGGVASEVKFPQSAPDMNLATQVGLPRSAEAGSSACSARGQSADPKLAPGEPGEAQLS